MGSSQSNKYHRPDCVWTQKINPANAVIFKSPEEAQGRGYVPCKVCSPPTTSSPTQPVQGSSVSAPSGSAAVAGDEIVYVTRTGTKYHRAGCRYLSKSAIPMPVKEAAARYAPCSVCRPAVPNR